MEYSSATDAELLIELQSNNHGAFKEIYKRYWKGCFVELLKKSGNQELAEELTQQVFTSLWERRQVTTIRHLSSYLLSAVRFSFINHLKTILRFEQYVASKQQQSHAEQHGLEAQLAARELATCIEKGIRLLPKKTQEVFVLSRMEYLTVKEIAQQLKISEKAVEYHITQSLKTMRIALKDYLIAFAVMWALWGICW